MVLIIGFLIGFAIYRLIYNYSVKKEIKEVDFTVDKAKNRVFRDSLDFPSIFEDIYNIEGVNEELSNFFEFASYDIGNLKIYDEEIRIGDIAYINRYQKLRYDFPIGNHSVEVAVIRSYGVETAVMVRVKFSSMDPISWSNANISYENEAKISSDVYHGYLNESGWLILGNMKQQFRYGGHFKPDMFDDVFDPSNQYNRHAYLFESDGGNNLIMNLPQDAKRISYYIGYDSNGNICRLLIDYNLFNWRYPMQVN